ncbi:MAG: hypothetical protein AAFR59_00125 [Bacteroidota bacterium]
MSTETIIIFIGAALMLIPILDSLLSLGLMNSKIGVPLGILGFCLTMYGGYSVGTVTMPGQLEEVARGNKLEIKGPIEKVQITSPLQGDSVECRVLTMGVYPAYCP